MNYSANLKQKLLAFGKNYYPSAKIRPIHLQTRTSHSVHIIYIKQSSRFVGSQGIHVGLEIACGDLCPNICWFVVLCQFWLQCSLTINL